MNSKILSENGWKVIIAKSKGKIKDNGLQKALAAYEKLDDEELDGLLKCVTAVGQFAAALKRNRDVAANEEATDCLEDIIGAAESEKRCVTKAKAEADKAAALAAKAEAQAAQQEGEEAEEEEEENADSLQKLKNALKTLKTAKKPYYFLACDAKPYAVVISKKDIRKNAQARKELSEMAAGSTRPPKFGECRFENGKLIFEMEKPISGLARILQKWIKEATGLGLKVMVGAESGDEAVEEQPHPDHESQHTSSVSPQAHNSTDETEAQRQQPQPAAMPPAGASTSTPGRVTLEKSPEIWLQTRDLIDGRIEQLKQAIRKEFAGEEQGLLEEIGQKMNKLDGILDVLDHKLADALAKAHAATDPAGRRSELARAKVILANYIKYVKAEPLISQMDANPFGVKTELKQTLVARFTHMAQAIG